VKRVLLIAPYADGTDVGEAWSTHQWAERLSTRCELTVLTARKRTRASAVDQLPDARVIEWDEWPIVGRHDRFNSMLKPAYIGFYRTARKWIRRELARGTHFDLVHQVAPLALRYACPAIGLGLPTIIGPLGGSLDSPPDFEHEFGTEPWYVKLRRLDRWRLRRDRTLRSTFADADCVVGVAPYVHELLESCGISPRRFELMNETGVIELPEPVTCEPLDGRGLRLLFVGRIVRSKGVRDAVRAMAKLGDVPDLRFDVVGDGDDAAACRGEAERLELGDRVVFHGKRPRAECDDFYRSADVFFFPSMREPSGNVVLESLSHGLPVIAADRGGPGYVVDDSCGVKVPVETPDQFADDLAAAVRRFVDEPDLAVRLSSGARARVESIALWENKVDWLLGLYDELCQPDGTDRDA
jgi:glycosyltransferase involved in cell wall biosynthesis